MSKVFLQVEWRVIFPKFSHKIILAFNQGVPWIEFEKKLEALAGILDVPEEIRGSSVHILAPQLQGGSFRDSDVAVRLGHCLGSGASCKIQVLSVKAVQTSLWNLSIPAKM